MDRNILFAFSYNMPINKEKILKNISLILLDKGLKLSICESCTGGLISKICTDYKGSSAWFSGGVVSYSNSLKEIIGVKKSTLIDNGAVSENTAKEMSLAVLNFTKSDVCLSVTGIAGPTGGTKEKPVGTVYFSFVDKNGFYQKYKYLFKGSRDDIRCSAAEQGIQIILDCMTIIKTQ